MKTTSFRHTSRGLLALTIAAVMIAAAGAVQADSTKADNSNALNTVLSWATGGIPGATDRAIWNSTAQTPGATLNAAGTWGQIQILDPGFDPIINTSLGDVLLALNGIGGVGIDMSNATRDLSFSDSADQRRGVQISLGNSLSFDVASGRTLWLNYLTGVGVTTLLPSSLALQSHTLTVTGAGTTRIDAPISGTGGAITKNGTGTLTLTGTNTYTGTTTVNAGILELGGIASSAAGGDYIINNGGTLKMTGPNWVFSNLNEPNVAIAAGGTFDLGDLGSNARIGTLSGGGTILAGGGDDSVLQVCGASDNEFSGTITGTMGIHKHSAGTLTLSGANTYTGATAVNAGTLLVNGSTHANSAVTVASGAILGGSGTIGGATTINGNLNPGTSAGVLGFGDDLTLGSESTTTMEILGDGMVRGTDYDGIDVAATLGYGGTLNLDVGTTFGVGEYVFNLFNAFTNTSSSFASVELVGAVYTGLLDNDNGVWTRSEGLNTWTFTQDTGDLVLTVVPEPGAWMLALIAAACGLLVRRRR